MRTYDLPTLRRSTVGFDRLLNLVNDATIEYDSYPPFDVERAGENEYLISLALAGFSAEEVTITAEQSALTVEGRKSGKESHDYLHRGITVQPFRRVFNLAEYVAVKDASFENGTLRIALVREVPEALKPRRIPIEGAARDDRKSQQTRAA
jgi:molecular chaperone IbpA